MNSRKLRVLALLLSAIMIFTAVPSTLFAGEFGDGEVVTWDDNTVVDENEAPTDFGSDVPVEVAEFDEGFSAEVADDVFVGAGENGIQYELWSLTDDKVRIYYLDKSYNNNLGYKDYAATEVSMADNCTRAYLTAKVDNGKGNTAYEINSNIANLDASWSVYETSSRLTTFTTAFEPDGKDKGSIVKLGTEASTGEDDLYKVGLRKSTAHPAHVVDPDSAVIYDQDFESCDNLKLYYQYGCKNCTTKGYITNVAGVERKDFDPTLSGAITFGVTPDDTLSNIGYVYWAEAHVLENTSIVGYIINNTTTPVTATLTASSDSTTFEVGSGNTYYSLATKSSTTDYPWLNSTATLSGATNTFSVVNSDFDTTTAKAGVYTDGSDSKWIVVNKSNCKNCNKKNIYTFTEDAVLIKQKAYYLGTNAIVDPLANPRPTVITINDDTTQKALADRYGTSVFYNAEGFTIKDCTANNGVGYYYEVWYTQNLGDVSMEKPIAHTLAAHSKKTTVYTTSAVSLGQRNAAVNDKLSDLAKVCKVDDDGIPTASLDCKDVNYYEVTVCNCKAATASVTGVWTVLGCEAKVAKGNGRHILNSDAERVSKLVGPGKTPKYDDLVAEVKTKGNVVFANNTQDCTKAGTVEISYLCSNCGNLVSMGTFAVAKDDHFYEWVEIEPTEHATCPKDGYVTQQSQCKKCQTPEPNKKTVTAVEPKLNHKNIKDVTEYAYTINKNGDIIGPLEEGSVYTGANGINGINRYTTERRGTADNASVIGAKITKLCPDCQKEIDITEIDAAYKTTAEAAFSKDTIEYRVDKLEENSFKCNNGKVTITATAYLDGVPYSATATYDYWKNNNAFQGSNVHTPVTKADGSIVCIVCNEVIKPAASESTTTKETPSESTSEETPAESSTKETPAESSTKETPAESTTKEAPVEPTTAEPATMPAQVTGLKVTKNSPAKKVIAVKYKATKNADKYTINIRKAGTTAWTKNLTDGAVTTYEITGLTRGEAYDIRVAAIANGVAGPRSSHQYRWLEKVTLEKPKRVKGQNGAVIFSWNDVGATKYQVYYSADEAFKTGVKSGFVTGTSAKVTDLTPGTYYFKVRCFKTIDGITYTGAWSNVKSKKIK